MKNKKSSFKNRLKGFYIEPSKTWKNRIEEEEDTTGPQENNEKEEGDENLQNPEERDELS